MKLKLFIALAFVAVVTASCGDSTTKKLVKELKSGYDHNGKQVELVGYFGVPRSLMIFKETISLEFYNIAGQSGQNDAYLCKINGIYFGRDKPNAFYVPEKYTGSDVEIYDSEGNKHGYRTQFKVVGTVKYTNKNWKENLDKKRAEVEDAIDESNLQRLEDAVKKREDETGDPNDYSFEIEVESITAL